MSLIQERILAARRSNVLHLSNMGLKHIPPVVFTMTNLRRLDVGWNAISRLPSEISRLEKLEEPWINSNPLTEIPEELLECTDLKVIDLRDTKVTLLPSRLGRLKKLVKLETEGCRLEKNQQSAVRKGCTFIMDVLAKQDQLELRKKKLFVRLRDTVYRELSRKKRDSNEIIQDLVDRTFDRVSDPDEQRSLIRNAGRLFPSNIENASIQSIHKTLVSLRNQNEKKRLKAEFELRLRQIYFGTIDVERVEGIVNNVMNVVPSLEEAKFLIKHARKILPVQSEDLGANDVYDSLTKLRDRLQKERDEGIRALRHALSDLYADVEPHMVDELNDKVSSLFKKTEDLKMLAADAGTFFPMEFETAKPRKIRRSFMERKRSLQGR